MQHKDSGEAVDGGAGLLVVALSPHKKKRLDFIRLCSLYPFCVKFASSGFPQQSKNIQSHIIIVCVVYSDMIVCVYPAMK